MLGRNDEARFPSGAPVSELRRIAELRPSDPGSRANHVAVTRLQLRRDNGINATGRLGSDRDEVYLAC